MEMFDRGLPNPIVIKTAVDFDALGIKNAEGNPYTVEGIMQLEMEDRKDTLMVLSGVVGLSYAEDFLTEVLAIYQRGPGSNPVG
jgi:hypothetical protein